MADGKLTAPELQSGAEWSGAGGFSGTGCKWLLLAWQVYRDLASAKSATYGAPAASVSHPELQMKMGTTLLCCKCEVQVGHDS